MRMIKKLLYKVFPFLKPVYNLVYRRRDGEVKMYKVSKPKLRNQFDNMREGQTNVGVRAWCYNKKGIRSFRYDGIVSLTK